MTYSHKDTNLQQFGVVFHYANIGIIVTDLQEIITSVNPFAEKQFGYKEKEVAGKKIRLLIPQKYRDGSLKELHNYYAHPEPHRLGEGKDLFALRKDGTTFPVEINLSPYSFDEKQYMMIFIIDLTIRYRFKTTMLQQKVELERIAGEVKALNLQLEEKVQARTKMLQETLSALEKSREELRESLENEKNIGDLKSKFLTMASHEFRTPLSTILSSAFLLEKYNNQEVPEKRLTHIERIRNSVQGLKSILDDFLSIGKLEEGLVSSAITETDTRELHQMVQSLTIDMEQLLKHGQKIIFNCEIDTMLITDIGVLKNILMNLVSNAIKFSGDGASIYIICNLLETEVSITVRDHGIGISEGDMKHLTERFFRGKNATYIQGTGLGLNIVCKYLELINGRLEIKSKLNEGSDFIIHLPRYKSSPYAKNTDH